MMIFKKAIPRRKFLRSAGATLALPLLDAMVPAFASSTSTGKAPVRLAFIYVPMGIIMEKWTPATEGANFQMTQILEPLTPFRNYLLVLSGLAHNMGVAHEGEGVGDHARASAVFLTGAHPKKTEGADLRAGISIDQIAAKELGKETQLASLELGLDSNEVVGLCDTGYSCAYTNTVSWRSASMPMPMENKPRAVFERLFGDSDNTEPSERHARFLEQRSLLDLVKRETSQLLAGLGPGDRLKLTEYMDAIRDVERRIQMAEAQPSRELPSFERPIGVPEKFTEHAKLMLDLQILAFQSDLTRVTTFMIGQEGNARVYDELGISDSYHPLTHHQKDAEKIEKVTKIDILHTQVLAHLVEKLQAAPDGDGSLLDHSMIVYGSALSDGNLHEHNNTPTLVIGGGGIKGGRHLRYQVDTPMANLYLTMLDKLGISMDSFGDSTGRIEL
jgi:hypothetical protein